MSIDVSTLSHEEIAGELFCIGISGPEIDAATAELLDEIKPGGICLFARNIKTSEQTRSLLDDLRARLQNTPILAVDQEGGTVDRLRRIVTPLAPAGKVLTAVQAERMGSLVAGLLRILGFNTDFAPVVDVVDGRRAEYSNGLFTRPFGRSKEMSAALAEAFLHGLETGGISGCLKHFPGLGAATVDSHEELPQVDIDEAEFEDVDLFAYKGLGLIGAPAVMVGHATYPRLSLQESDQNGKLLPTSLSRSIVSGLLRERLGFAGLVITDDLEMGAILRGYGIGDASVMALDAGCDMLAICADASNIRAAHKAVVSALQEGKLDRSKVEASLDRINVFRSRLTEPLPFDAAEIDRLSKEIESFNTELDIQ